MADQYTSSIDLGSTSSKWSGGSGNPVSIDELNSFEYDGTNYLYDLEPLQQNLFWAGNFSSGDSTGVTGGGPKNTKKREFYNAQFRIQGVEFDGNSLTFEDDKLFQNSYVTGITKSKTVSITWLEDVYRSVQKYHLDWYNNWYDVNSDCFIIGPRGKYRSFDLVGFHYKKVGGIADTANAEPLFLITFRGLVPTSAPKFTFNYSGAGEPTITITYKLNAIGMYYNSDLLKDANGAEVGTECFNDLTKSSASMWQPLVSESSNSLEGNRITHAIVSSLASEGRLA